MAAIASLQRGRVARRQLLAAGRSPSAIGRLVARGRLVPVHAGVYAVGHTARTPLAAETAALLAVREGAVLSHASAAALWGLVARVDGPIHVTLAGTSPGGRPRGVIVHRSRLLGRRDVRVHRGLPVTSPARTLLDRAATVAGRELERSLDQALILGVMTRRDVSELLRRSGGHSGRCALQALVDSQATATFTRSEAEERFLSLVRQAELPRPLTNVRRHGYEIDFLFEPQRLAVEIDGYTFHRGRGSFERDRRRDAKLKAVGIDTSRITWRQLTDEPIAVIVRLGQALAGQGL